MQLGMDFGTCFSSAAVLTDGAPRPVKLGHNRTSLPSTVFLKDDGTLAVGDTADNERRRDVDRYRREFKRALGDSAPLFLGGQAFLPEELIAAVLRLLKTRAEQRFRQGESFSTAVITVPADYEGHRRALMHDAAARAGFKDVVLLEEPIAAAQYYLWQSAGRDGWKQGDTILVYDLGGGTFDAALLRKQGAGYVSLAPPVSRRIGGMDFDQCILRHLLPSLPEAVREALADPGARGKLARDLLSEQCRLIKERLSEDNVAEGEVSIEGLHRPRLDRETFEGLIAELVEETVVASRELLAAARMEAAEVRGVLLIGGSTRIPYVQQALSRGLERPLFLVDDPELAVALGAALHTAEPTVPDAVLMQYRIACEMAIADGSLGAAEARRLDALEKQLGLGSQTAAGIERATMGNTRDALRPSLVVSSLGGGDHTSIQAAVDAAEGGMRVIVKPGIYRETVRLRDGVEVMGEDRATTILDGIAGNAATLAGGSAVVREMTLLCTVEPVPRSRVEGGVRRATYFCVNVSGGTLHLENCNVTSSSLSCLGVHGGGVARASGCRFHDGASAGVLVYEGSRAELLDCQVERNRLAGVEARVQGHAELVRCRITGNGYEGVWVHYGGTARLEACDLAGNRMGPVKAEPPESVQTLAPVGI